MPPTGQTTHPRTPDPAEAEVRSAGKRILAAAAALYRWKKTLATVATALASLATWGATKALDYAAADYAQTKSQAAAAIDNNQATARLVESRWQARNAEIAGVKTDLAALQKSVDDARQDIRAGFQEQNKRIDEWARAMIRDRRAASLEAAQ